MFELTKTPAKLASVNARAEIHGEKKVPAFDLKWEVAADNGVLAMFSADLRSSLYKKPEDQEDMIDPERLSVLKYPKMAAFKWDFEGRGYTLVVSYGIGGPSDISLGDVQVDGFRLEPQNGGTVLVSFRTVAHPEEGQVGKLCGMIQTTVDITLTPPAPENVQQLFGDAA